MLLSGLPPQAFIKLESSPTADASQRQRWADLAMSIFLKCPPVDPRALRETRDKGVDGTRYGCWASMSTCLRIKSIPQLHLTYLMLCKAINPRQ